MYNLFAPSGDQTFWLPSRVSPAINGKNYSNLSGLSFRPQYFSHIASFLPAIHHLANSKLLWWFAFLLASGQTFFMLVCRPAAVRLPTGNSCHLANKKL
jgi:hypothetical protein